MKILHVAAHLGGGVGKAHAELTAAMPLPARQTYILLEEPRDRRYADAVEAAGRTVIVARNLAHVAALAEDADIVQFEFWNHPKLLECLARTPFPAMRSLFWSHVSGLFRPIIKPSFLACPDRFVFTTPASLALSAIAPLRGKDPDRFAVISSAYGFGAAEQAAAAEVPAGAPLAYLGTVDFVKMSPFFFDIVDGLSGDVTAHVWGAHETAGAVQERHQAMRHPGRVRLMGQTADPLKALAASRIFLYPLQPDHYGTAENALIEAMSLGLVPVVLANPAETAIIRQGQTGFIASSVDDCIAIVERLLVDPDLLARVGRQAREETMAARTPDRASRQFLDLWTGMMSLEPRRVDFASITGPTPLDWYCATTGEEPAEVAIGDEQKHAKGTLSHFRSAFPDDPCWGG